MNLSPLQTRGRSWCGDWAGRSLASDGDTNHDRSTMAAAPDPPMLDDAAPRALFQGVDRSFTERDTRVIALPVCFFGAVLLALAGLTTSSIEERVSVAVPGILALAAGAFLLYRRLTRYETALVISQEGVSYGRRMWRWGEIAEIGGYEHFGVQFYIQLRTNADDASVRKRWFFEGTRIDLYVTPAPSKDELCQVLTQLINSNPTGFRHVKINFTLLPAHKFNR